MKRLDMTNLTVREREIISLVNSGMSNRQIAATLAIAEGTVKQHLHSIYRQLRLRDSQTARAKLRNVEA